MIARMILVLQVAQAVPAAHSVASHNEQWYAVTDSGQTLRAGIRTYRQAHEAEILREFVDFLAIPNFASDSVGIARNASALMAMLQRRGIRSRLLASGDGPPAVFGELLSPGATITIVFYAHYDGQSVTPSSWSSPPWQPLLRSTTIARGGRALALPTNGDTVPPDARVYARSASDDKAPILALLAAVDALRALSRTLSVNVKFFFEGEEEAGSPHLGKILERYRDELRADLWLMCDGPVYQTGAPQLVFGARGVFDLEVTAYGPARPLHSGHYGNWAPNPAMILINLLATLRAPDGRVIIPGFYDDVRPLSKVELDAVAASPPVELALMQELEIAETEGHGERLLARILQPALNVRGLLAGSVGEDAPNAIPSTARASIDFRLVPNQTPASIQAHVESHLKRHGYTIIHDEPDSVTRATHARIIRLEWGPGYPSYRLDLDTPMARSVTTAAARALGRVPVLVPSLGGSAPLATIAAVLRVPVIIVPIVNYDNNQHAANENVRLQNLWDGIELYGGLMTHISLPAQGR